MKSISGVFTKAWMIFIIMTILCGLVYTLVITGISQALFREKAGGSIVEVNGVKYASVLLGQEFNDESHLWGRIMNVDVGTFADENGDPLMYAWASNKSPAGQEMDERIAERVTVIQEANPDARMDSIPVELVTGSGSGLDPHISPAAAEYQVPRLAKANRMSEEEVREVISHYTEGKLFGVLGEETVNVLEVNLALEGILEK